MDIQRIEFPKHLLEHNLSAQEQMNIPADKLALAKDWNILKRQNEWMMEQLVINRNLMADQDGRMKLMDGQLEFWTRVRWGVVTLFGLILGIVTILQKVGVFK